MTRVGLRPHFNRVGGLLLNVTKSLVRRRELRFGPVAASYSGVSLLIAAGLGIAVGQSLKTNYAPGLAAVPQKTSLVESCNSVGVRNNQLARRELNQVSVP